MRFLAPFSLLVVRSASLARQAQRMPRNVAKQNLPSKICVTCNRPFTWRKKWERCWDEVTTCSKRCNAERRKLKGGGGGGDADDDDATAVSSASDEAPAMSARKLAKKAAKAERRAKREGTASKETGRKACDLCESSVNMLIRCRTDETKKWRMVCGKCWTGVSGGVTDGDAAHPHYAYGGLWRNRNPQSGEAADAADAAVAALLGGGVGVVG